MNIWLLTSEYPPDYGGGIATYNFHTARMLCQRGHTLTVFDADENVSENWEIEECSPQLRVVRFKANQRPHSSALGEFARWSYDASLVLADFCRKEGPPDVIEAQEYLGMPYFTLQHRLLMDDDLARTPVLVTAHTPLYLCHEYDLLPNYRFPGYWIGEMERFSMATADEVIFPSQYLRTEVEKDLPKIQEHSRVIANPYQENESLAHETEKSNRRGFMFAAKLERRKGIEPLLSTFRQLWNAGLDEPLFLAGDDWYDDVKGRWMSDAIKQRYGRYIDDKLLSWEGKIKPQDIEQKLGEVRAAILPSLLENFPYAILEAMAAGCPVIVSENGGHAEMVEEGVSGYIFSHLKPGDLTDKIQAVLHLSQDEQNRMAAAEQARVKQISGYEVIAPQKEEAFEQACEGLRERIQPRKYFPFLREIRKETQPFPGQAAMSEAGLLSVVIPFYNLGTYLEESLKPFENLKEIPFEIIVVDDGSSDRNSLEILTHLQERYHFRVEQTKNRGLATARNTGARIARGEYLAFLDADDWMDPQFYPQALDILANYENVSFVGCWVEYFGEAQGYWPTWAPEVPYALVHNPINTGALVYRMDDFLRYGLNDPDFALVMEDYDSMLSMLENGCRGVVIPEPYHKYRVRRNSMFHTSSENSKIWTYQQLAQKHQRIYAAYHEEIVGLMNANGPGYLFDNPTLNYPSLGYLAELNPSNGRLHEADFARVPAATLFYYALRSTFLKPYRKLSPKLPWLTKFAQKLKDELGQ